MACSIPKEVERLSKTKQHRDRLLRHCRNVHPEVITLLRAQGKDPEDFTLTDLSNVHAAIPHPQQDELWKEEE